MDLPDAIHWHWIGHEYRTNWRFASAVREGLADELADAQFLARDIFRDAALGYEIARNTAASGEWKQILADLPKWDTLVRNGPGNGN